MILVTVDKNVRNKTYKLTVQEGDLKPISKTFGDFEMAIDFLQDFGVNKKEAQIYLK